MNDSYHLKKCLQLIEEKVQWGESKEWINADFQKLSDKIREASNILISAHTLKRLFGKIKTYKEHYNPQVETKNALALFLGFQNWDDFITTHTVPSSSEKGIIQQQPELITQEIPTSTSNNKHTFKKILFWLIMAIVITTVTLFYYNRKRSSVAKNVSFSGKYLKGAVPHTAIFNYKINSDIADSIYIDFGNNYSRPLPKDKTSVSYCYQIPGIYTAHLRTRNEKVADLKVYVTTKGWENSLILDNHPLYSALQEPVSTTANEGRMYLSPLAIQSKGHDIKQRYWLQYSNIGDFSSIVDSMTFETRFKNNASEGGVSCFDVITQLLGDTHIVQTHFVEPGCFMWSKIQAGEVQISGEHDDLSSFGKDLSDWRVVKIKLKNKTAQIFFENELIYTITYKQPIGKLKGVIFKFRGSGSVDYVRLYNEKDTLMYAEEF